MRTGWTMPTSNSYFDQYYMWRPVGTYSTTSNAAAYYDSWEADAQHGNAYVNEYFGNWNTSTAPSKEKPHVLDPYRCPPEPEPCTEEELMEFLTGEG